MKLNSERLLKQMRFTMILVIQQVSIQLSQVMNNQTILKSFLYYHLLSQDHLKLDQSFKQKEIHILLNMTRLSRIAIIYITGCDFLNFKHF